MTNTFHFMVGRKSMNMWQRFVAINFTVCACV
jgi:hypothetical protein